MHIYSWTVGAWFRFDDGSSRTYDPTVHLGKEGSWTSQTIMLFAAMWNKPQHGVFLKARCVQVLANKIEHAFRATLFGAHRRKLISGFIFLLLTTMKLVREKLANSKLNVSSGDLKLFQDGVRTASATRNDQICYDVNEIFIGK